MDARDKRGKRVSIFLIRYPIYKSSKIPRPTLLVIPGVIQKKSENKCYALYQDNKNNKNNTIKNYLNSIDDILTLLFHFLGK